MTPQTIVTFLTADGSTMKLHFEVNVIDQWVLQAGEVVFMTPKDGTYLLELDLPSDAEASTAYKVMGISSTEIESKELNVKVVVPEIHLHMISGPRFLQ